MRESGFIAAQFLLGLGFAILGLDGFFRFLPLPPVQGEILQLVKGLETTGYFFPVVNSVEILGGLLLMINRFVPLMILILAPIVINIFLFHMMAGFGTMTVLAGVMTCLNLFLAFSYRHYYQELFVARGVPDLSHNYITAEFM